MKGKSIPIKNYIIKYGVAYGLAITIFSLASYLLGYYIDQGIIHLIILFSIAISSIIFGQLMFKRNNEGYLSLGESVKIAIGISLIGGLIAVFWKILLIKVIDPDIIIKFEEKQIKRIAETSNNFTQENIQRTLEMNKKYSSSIRMIFMTIIEHSFNGALFGLITGLIIRKKRDPFK